MERVKVTLDATEYTALVKLCELELRPVPDQVRAIVRERLRRAGLLPQPADPEREAVRC